MKKVFAIVLLGLVARAFCGTPPQANRYNPFFSTAPIMCDKSNGWRLAESGGIVIDRTSDGGKHWIDVSPPRASGIVKQALAEAGEADDYGTFPSLSATDGKHAWIALVVDFKKVLVDFTSDGGLHWTETTAAITGAVNAYINFPDDRHGFLLAVSDAAAGSEHRWLYGTDDGGKRWYVLSPPGGGFPTGITFRTPLDGWATAVYTGEDFFPLYCTHDGGKAWKEQKFPIPKEFAGGYADIEPPVFDGPAKKHGALPAKLVKSNPEPGIEAEVNFETNDGGKTWHLPASGIKSKPRN